MNFIFIANFWFGFDLGDLLRGDFDMLNVGSKKHGFTLIEVLVVVSIMGILVSMGVASLTGAVANARIRDYALNTESTAGSIEQLANMVTTR